MSVVHVTPPQLPANPAFSWAVRVPAGADTVYVGGQNGIGPDGTLVGPGAQEQTRAALTNLEACLEAAGAALTDVVRWSVLVVSGTDAREGLAAFAEVWPADTPPPVITVAFVDGLALPGALVEIEAIAAVL